MNISYNWLNEFIELPLSPEETAEKLTLIGLEVEGLEEHGHLLEGVIVGKVLEVSDHPNADRLHICKVDLGDEQVQIICGADNVAAGQKVPVATVGTTLPAPKASADPFKIKKAKLRGAPSNGMICAEDELGLGSDHSGIMVLDENLEVGTPIYEVFDLQQDTIFDVAITPNRPDATCHLGVARDLAAALNLALRKPFDTEFKKGDALNNFEIEIENPEKCRRYVGKIIEDVTIGESPSWLKNRLEALGVRPVNNVVDVTNYVMFELGQPLHAFDKNMLRGDKIVIRDFDKKITFETLDHVKRDCTAGTLFICDGEVPVAIAGIMGGVDSEVSSKTTDILLESAYFEPGSVRKTAKEQSLQTDASYRFERGIDPEIQRIAAERAAALIAELAGGSVQNSCSDIYPVKHEAKKLTLRKSYVNRLLGTDFSTDEIANLLKGLELNLDKKDEETLTYTIPSFRPDLEREVDLIEEVGRLYDYNNIPEPKHGAFASPEPLPAWEQLNTKIKDVAKGLRFREIYSNSLVAEKEAARFGDVNQMLHTLNHISADMTTLRPTLLHGFLSSAAYNFNRNASEVRFFETGHVFRKSDDGTYYRGIEEDVKILFGLAGLKAVEHWSSEPQEYTVFELKAVINSFLASLSLRDHVSTEAADAGRLIYSVGDTKIGEVFVVNEALLDAYDLNVPTFAAEFSISTIYKLKKSLPSARYEPVPKFPAFEFDFGVIVDASLPADALLHNIKATAGDLLEELQVFDIFEGESLGEDKKSIAFRLTFLDKNKTLTIKDVEPIIENILKRLDEKYSAKLRS